MYNEGYRHFKKLILFFIAGCLFMACYKNETQNFDTNVSGKVTDINTGGIANVIIYIDTGKSGNYIGPVYRRYDSIVTDVNGNYSYLIKGKGAGYLYQVCCKTPPGYTRIDELCRSVDVIGGSASNVINFNFIR